MDYGALPPEVNSARLYAGPGSAPMLGAAAAWDALSTELRSVAASYSSAISGLTTAWSGPSSASMAAAAGTYVAWLQNAAAQAEQTANQARAAATAYETAFAATVPPPVVAANRAELASLVSTNVLGQNTAAIAAIEAQYARMWAQDAAAMYGYAGQSATASTMQPFDPPSQNTNQSGTAAQSAAVAQSVGTSAGSTKSALSQLTSATPNALRSLAAPAAASPPSSSSLLSSLKSLTGPTDPLTQVLNLYQTEGKAVLFANDTLISNIMGFALAARGFKTGVIPAIPPAAAAVASGTGSAAEGLGAGAQVVGSASLGQAGLVGSLSVPPSWAVATPAIRTVAAVLSGTSESAIGAAAVSEGSFFSGVAAAGMLGGTLGAAIPRAIPRVGGTRRNESGRDGASLKGSASPENLQRVVAEMAKNPDSVQHWHTDPDHLDGLLDELRKKPGTHAVHVKNGKSKMASPGS